MARECRARPGKYSQCATGQVRPVSKPMLARVDGLWAVDLGKVSEGNSWMLACGRIDWHRGGSLKPMHAGRKSDRIPSGDVQPMSMRDEVDPVMGINWTVSLIPHSGCQGTLV